MELGRLFGHGIFFQIYTEDANANEDGYRAIEQYHIYVLYG